MGGRHARIQERSRGCGGAPLSRRGWVNNNGEVVSIFNSFCHAYVDMHVVFFSKYVLHGIYSAFIGGWYILCQRVGGAGEVGT